MTCQNVALYAVDKHYIHVCVQSFEICNLYCFLIIVILQGMLHFPEFGMVYFCIFVNYRPLVIQSLCKLLGSAPVVAAETQDYEVLLY